MDRIIKKLIILHLKCSFKPIYNFKVLKFSARERIVVEVSLKKRIKFEV